MSTLTKPQAHILRVIVKKIFRICPRYYVWCLLFALFKSLETLSRILLPTLLLDEMTHAIRFDRIVIWGSLCVCIPMLFSAVNTFIATVLEDCAGYIEDELALSIDRANMQVRYMEFDAPDIHAALQEIKDGQNMVGPITRIIRNHVLSIMQHVISLLLYIPILWRLIATDALSIAAGFPGAWIAVIRLCFYCSLWRCLESRLHCATACSEGAFRWWSVFPALKGHTNTMWEFVPIMRTARTFV